MKYNEFMNVYINTKISGEIIESSLEPLDIIKKAKSLGILKRWDNDIFYCCFKTLYQDQEAILMVFSMEVLGPSGGSSSASEKIMYLVDNISKELQRIDDLQYSKFASKDTKRKNIVLLKVIKIIREDDIL